LQDFCPEELQSFVQLTVSPEGESFSEEAISSSEEIISSGTEKGKR